MLEFEERRRSVEEEQIGNCGETMDEIHVKPIRGVGSSENQSQDG